MSNFLRACGAQPFIRFYVFRGEFVPWYTPGRNKCTFTLLHQIRTKLLRNPHPMDMFNVPCSVGCCLLDMESWNLDRFRSFHLVILLLRFPRPRSAGRSRLVALSPFSTTVDADGGEVGAPRTDSGFAGKTVQPPLLTSTSNLV